jgi:5-methylcytosine-specific restriction enzyme A
MSQHHARIKNDPRWKTARQNAMVRDDHTCTECGDTGVPLQVDHILDLAIVLAAEGEGRLPDDSLAFDLDNLRTLCVPCHKAKAPAEADLVRQAWCHPDYPELADLVL